MRLACSRPCSIYNVSSVFHSFLRQVEVVAFGIVGAESGEGSVGRPPEHGNVGIFLFDACDGFFDVVDVDAKMMQPRHVSRLSADNRHTDITVADTDCVIRPDRFLFFGGARFGSFHPEHGFVELRLPHEVFTDNSGMLNFR